MSAGIRKVQAAKAFHQGLKLLHSDDPSSAKQLHELVMAQDTDPRNPVPKQQGKRSLPSSSSTSTMHGSSSSSSSYSSSTEALKRSRH